MRVKINKTNVMISGEWQKGVKWPCSVCDRGVVNKFNTVYLLSEVGVQEMQWYKGQHVQSDEDVYRGCVNPVTGTGHTSVDIDVNANLELVDKFCYLGDMLTVDRDDDAAVKTRI